MTDTEAKALALVNEFRAKCAEPTLPVTMSHVWAYGAAWEALCRAIEREAATEASHAAELRELKERFDAFRQEVSDAAQSMETAMRTGTWQGVALDRLKQFILPKPDPLAEVMDEMGFGRSKTASEEFHAALAARGGKIVWEAGE